MNKEQLIIDQLRSGNNEPLGVIYSRHRNEFIGWMRKKYSCNEDEARDLFQFAVLAFYQNVANGKLVKIESSLKTYLFSIGKNKFLGNQKEKGRYTFNLEEEFIDLSSEDQTQKMRDERKIKVISECMKDLGDPCHTLIKMTYFLKQSMEEICRKLNYKNTETAKNVKYKCMQRLRKLVGQRLLILTEEAYGF